MIEDLVNFLCLESDLVSDFLLLESDSEELFLSFSLEASLFSGCLLDLLLTLVRILTTL